jgi:hypothetical protein
VLLSWINAINDIGVVVSMFTTSLFVFLMQRKGKKQAEKEKEEGKGE